MVSASEAKVMTRKAQFAASGFAALAESTIKEAANNGESEATVLVPLNVVVEQYEGAMVQVETIINDRQIIQNFDEYIGEGFTNKDLMLPTDVEVSTSMGETIKVIGDGEEITYSLKNNVFTVVGVVQTPYWVSYERGVTTAGSGKLGDFVYVTNDAFTDKINYYSEAYVTLEGADEFLKFIELAKQIFV